MGIAERGAKLYGAAGIRDFYGKEKISENQISGGETFVIDLSNGATTTYTASYADHPKYGSTGKYDLTLTFTANGSRDLFRVDSTHTEHKPSGESEMETDEDCIIFNLSAEYMRDYELRAIQIDNHTPITVIFNVNRILLP